MSQNVRDQSEAELKLVMFSIFVALVDYNKLLDESMQIWTSLQEDPNVQKLQEEMQKKQQKLEESQETMNTLPISEKLTKINEAKVFQKRIKELKREEKMLIEITQPWQDKALQLSQIVDDTIQELRQKEETLLQRVVDHVIEELLE